MSVFDKGLITVVTCAAVFALLAIPLILRKVPRNVVYGFRTRATLGSDHLWYEANAHFGRGLLLAEVVAALAVFLLHGMPSVSARQFLNGSIVALAGAPLVAALATAHYLRKLQRGG